ncbi:MAG: hypothetical protein ACO3JL_15870 [Myxococcota bacterium]
MVQERVMSQSVISPARQARRLHILEAARALLGSKVGPDFDPVKAPLCAIDVVMVAGSPWLSDGLERDFPKDESGYRKIGGGANTPSQAYFFRSVGNLIHYLKRAGFYVPRGGGAVPCAGMACFFEWDDRGRFNFAPHRSGIITEVKGGRVTRAVFACPAGPGGSGFVVRSVDLSHGDARDLALIGYSDLP